MQIECTHCGHVGTAPQEFAGKNVRCPKCKKLFAAGGDSEFVLATKPANVEGATLRVVWTLAKLLGVVIALLIIAKILLFAFAANTQPILVP